MVPRLSRRRRGPISLCRSADPAGPRNRIPTFTEIRQVLTFLGRDRLAMLGNRVVEQQAGVAVGSSCSPVLANRLATMQARATPPRSGTAC